MNAAELKNFPLFAEFSDEEREVVLELLEERKLPDGKSIFREGSESDGLVLLQEGRMKLKSKRTGAIVGIVEAPFQMGAVSLFSLGNREVSALATGPATVWLLPRSGLSRLAGDAPYAAFRLAEAVAGDLAVLLRERLDCLAADTGSED
ncbi:MAG: Crp/Fnr family transcriptional regulator [Myxococcota bacterium]